MNQKVRAVALSVCLFSVPLILGTETKVDRQQQRINALKEAAEALHMPQYLHGIFPPPNEYIAILIKDYCYDLSPTIYFLHTSVTIPLNDEVPPKKKIPTKKKKSSTNTLRIKKQSHRTEAPLERPKKWKSISILSKECCRPLWGKFCPPFKEGLCIWTIACNLPPMSLNYSTNKTLPLQIILTTNTYFIHRRSDQNTGWQLGFTVDFRPAEWCAATDLSAYHKLIVTPSSFVTHRRGDQLSWPRFLQDSSIFFSGIGITARPVAPILERIVTQHYEVVTTDILEKLPQTKQQPLKAKNKQLLGLYYLPTKTLILGLHYIPKASETAASSIQ